MKQSVILELLAVIGLTLLRYWPLVLMIITMILLAIDPLPSYRDMP